MIVLGAGHDLAESDRCRKVQIASGVVDSFGKLLASLGLSSTSRSRCEHRLSPSFKVMRLRGRQARYLGSSSCELLTPQEDAGVAGLEENKPDQFE